MSERHPGDRTVKQERATRQAAIAFGVAIIAALALLVVYARGGDTQWEGILLFVSFGAVGVGIGIWVKVIIGPDIIVEERYPLSSTPEEREAFEEELTESMDPARRKVLVRLLYGVGASLGLALAAPFLSLGPIFSREARRSQFVTDWQQGVRLVTTEGEALRPEDVGTDQIVTVFPDARGHPASAQAVLVGTRDGALDTSVLPEPDGVVDGRLVCYSKICTHAGCPVGLYRAAVGELLCPCHQSTFDVNAAAAVLSGPTGRPLPQLPIGVDTEGFLVALSDFSEPVGPSFWNMTHEQDDL